jgi:hypothetical protein
MKTTMFSKTKRPEASCQENHFAEAAPFILGGVGPIEKRFGDFTFMASLVAALICFPEHRKSATTKLSRKLQAKPVDP